MLQAERADFRQFVATLTVEEWAAPTLCADWTVRDVVAHVVGPPDVSALLRRAPGAVAHFGRQMDRANADRVGQFAGMSKEQILAAYDASKRVERPYVQVLTDKLIHHQDIRRPLGHPRIVPAERVEASLRRVIASRWIFGGRARVDGLRIEATDIHFEHGVGPTVTGSGEALLLALAGRRVALDDLDGEGLALLRSRIA